MPADRVPDISTTLTDARGNTNLQWWRFWSRIAGQFSGTDAPLMPVNVPGLLSIVNAQARPVVLTPAAVVEAAKQLLAAIPRSAGRDQSTADLALMAQRPVTRTADRAALDLATIALSRLRVNAAPTTQSLFEGTHAERFFDYPAAGYPLRTLFFENDRTVFYIVVAVDLSGSAITDGTNLVKWLGGDVFRSDMVGKTITIDLVDYLVAGLIDDHRLLATTPVPADLTASYTSSYNAWQYLTGTMAGPLFNLPTADLGSGDVGFRFFESVLYGHAVVWNNSAFMGAGTGWTFEAGEGSAYYLVAAAAPGPVGWHAVDGSTVNYLKSDATVGSRTLQNVAGTPAYLKVGSGGDSLNAPVAPTLTGTGTTDASGTGASVTDTDAAIAAGTGTPATFLTGVGFDDPGHTHALTGTTLSNTGEPESFYSQLWFRQ
jgi:hypothetical protein